MKLIIAGSRYLKRAKFSFVNECIKLFGIEGITEVVSGGASGVDEAGVIFALEYKIPVKPFYLFKKDWEEQGLAAGPLRNKKMAEYADELLLIWDGKSKGSASMKSEMQKLQKPIYEVIVRWE